MAMNLLKRMRILAPAALVMTACVGAFALDLPTKRVNGKTCYYYKVGNSETVYGIASKYGISRDDIIKYNPSAADGLKAGQILYFPVDQFGTVNVDVDSDGVILHEVKKGETLYGISHSYGVSVESVLALNPSVKDGVKAGSKIKIPQKGVDTSTNDADTLVIPQEQYEARLSQPKIEGKELVIAETVSDYETSLTEEEAIEEPKTYTVAVMLPFMLEEDKVSKASNQITDFYKGFLIAADSLSNSRQHIEILAYDTKGSLEQVKSILNTNTDLNRSSIIIAPSAQDQLQAIAEYGAKNDIYVLNNFVVKDTNYHNNAYILQSNVSTDRMYERAADSFIEKIGNDLTTIPVIINNTSGKQDKQAFINILTKRLASLGITPMTVEYSGNLHASTITEQLGDVLPGQKYAFISTSGSLNDFNKYAPGLQKFKDKLNNNGSDLYLYGYPEWTTFRSDAQELLHKIDTTIYSRFYADSNSIDVKGIEAAFKRWYGKAPADGVPSQAILGFDTGCYIMTALSKNLGDFSNSTNCAWQGAQSTFNFQHETGDSGQVNESVYIIHFMPGDIVETTVL
jgi:LysM repeat protein